MENKEAAKVAINLADIDECQLFGTLDRCLSEMKQIVDNPKDHDRATFQTLKHHLEDAELFCRYANKKLQDYGIKSLPPTAEQQKTGY